MAIIGSYENILLATDGSKYSEGAVRESIKLAKQCECKMTALNVVEFNPELAALAPGATDKIEADAKGMVDTARDRAQKEGVNCDSQVLRGVNPHEQIVEAAAKLKADLIVMGRHGRTGLTRLMMGSVTARVIGHSPVKVLVVPSGAELKFEKILVATDGSEFSEAAAKDAVGIAKCSGGCIVAISVAEVMGDNDAMKAVTENVNKVKELAKKHGVKADVVCDKGRADEAIVEAARRKGCDLIVMGSHGRTGLVRLLMGSTAERVVGHAECPVLVVKTA